MNIREFLINSYRLLKTHFGIDPIRMVRSLRGLPKYIYDYLRFRSSYTGRIELMPCLHDWYEEGGSTKSEYFWQDLLVARKIFEVKPDKHVDIGSRVDGFIAHVASFRELEVFDVRPITTKIPGVIFRQVDLMQPMGDMNNYCDSLSCLHALEHFGLGRYGDPIDPKGFERGLVNMARLLRSGGVFYLAVPIGIKRVQFNANHVFDPQEIIDLAEQCSLALSSLTVIRTGGAVKENIDVQKNLSKLSNQRYALGIFEFKKVKV